MGMIFDEMGSDDENDSQELVEYYNGASSEQREAMNEMCIYLCGWSLETIFERCGLRWIPRLVPSMYETSTFCAKPDYSNARSTSADEAEQHRRVKVSSATRYW